MRNLRRNVRACFVWFLVLACAGGSLSAAARAFSEVLCVGVDGHVAFEYAHAGDCAEHIAAEVLNRAVAGEAQPAFASAQHCGDCVDVVVVAPRGPLPKAATGLNQVKFDFPPLLLDASSGASHELLARPAPLRGSYGEPIARQFLRELRTVVLVI